MHKLTILLVVVALGGCSSPPTEPVFPTPFPEIATTPELETWTTSRILLFRETQRDQGYIGLGLQVLAGPAAFEAVRTEQVALIISSGDPPANWFATPLGTDPVVLVVNDSNPLRELSTGEAERILSGRTLNWQALGGTDLAIQPVIPLEGAETRNYLQKHVLGDHRFTSTALLGPTPDAVLELVIEDPGAIGVVPLSVASADIKMLAIDGQAPDHDDYPWLLPIIGTAPSEPAGSVREWLAWLQATHLD